MSCHSCILFPLGGLETTTDTHKEHTLFHIKLLDMCYLVVLKVLEVDAVAVVSELACGRPSWLGFFFCFVISALTGGGVFDIIV